MAAVSTSNLQGSPSIPHYVLVPDGLILAFAHDPLAVGVYVAIARLVVVAKAAVPLAARDLAAWIGSEREADRAAIMRRIVKLEEGGWVIAARTRAAKHLLLPTWGRDQEGVVRPWQPDHLNAGRPTHIRGRRVPLDLFDGYIGRLDPRPGQCPALISRYFNRPLLDLTDVGVYVVSLRAEVVPILRLQHLGLHGAAGVTMPVEPQSLMALAATGRLTTNVGDVISSVSLSFQGQSQHRIGAIAASVSGVDETGSPGRSQGESAGGSRGGSGDRHRLVAPIAEHSAENMATDLPGPLITWDVGSVHVQTNHDSHLASILAGGSESVIRLGEIGSASCTLAERFERPCAEHSYTSYGERLQASKLADSVLDGHRRLNPGRAIDTD